MSHVKCTSGTFGVADQKGFTIIEIAIVLVVIGLIVGAVVVGQSMIRTAQLEAVINEQDRYKKAVQVFKEKYMYLPGDMPTATNFWGTDSNCPNTASTTTAHTATCNGNGDGRIGNPYGTNYNGGCVGVAADSTWYENYRAWQQLADAGFIAGSYTGVTGGANSFTGLVGINVPISQLSGGGWQLYFALTTNINNANCANAFQGLAGHMLQIGGALSSTNPYGPILTPSEAFGIDSKIDDGLPGYGNVQSGTASGFPNCVTSSTASTATYKLTYNGLACSEIFVLGF